MKNRKGLEKWFFWDWKQNKKTDCDRKISKLFCTLIVSAAVFGASLVEAGVYSFLGLSGTGSAVIGPHGLVISGTSFSALNFTNQPSPLSANSNTFIATAVAFDPDTHQMYMQQVKSDGVYLVSINTETGKLTEVETIPKPLKDEFRTLVFDSKTNSLFGLSGAGGCGFGPHGFVFSGTGFSKLDLATGEETQLSTNSNTFIATAVAFDPDTHQMYMQQVKSDGVYLVSINTETGKLTEVETIPKPLKDEFRTLVFTSGAFLVDPIVPGQAPLIGPNSPLNGQTEQYKYDIFATKGRVVSGVAADGVAQSIVRIPTKNVGDQITLSIIKDNGDPGTSVNEEGGLIAIDSQGSLVSSSSSLSVTAQSTSEGPMAFAIYVAPLNFVREGNVADQDKAERFIGLHVSSKGATIFRLSVSIVRPPVYLVHGLWASPNAWDTFENEINNGQIFYIGRARYNAFVSGVGLVNKPGGQPGEYVTDSNPQYPAGYQSVIQQNSLGFNYNASICLNQISAFIQRFRENNNVSAVQADVVAHSMGGLVSKTMALQSDFLSDITFNRGPIHKLVTIGTPHLGSPVAKKLLSSENWAVRSAVLAFGSDGDQSLVSLQNININGVNINGAIGDLQGDGLSGGWLSQALGNLQSKQPFNVAYVFGVMGTSNLIGLDCSGCIPSKLRMLPGELASKFTFNDWPSVFSGQPNDGIVSQESQCNGFSGKEISEGVVHSDGVVALGFIGPVELEKANVIVKSLLDQAVDGPDFK